MYFHDEINELLFHSSSVEEVNLLGQERLEIAFFPRRQFLDQETLKVIIVPAIYSKGTAGLYNPKQNILFFADKVHQHQCERNWGLEQGYFDRYVIEENEPLPETMEIILPTIESAQLPSAYAIAAYALIEGANSHLGL